MSLVNFNSSVCNYTTEVVSISATPGSPSTNSYQYIDLEMVPDSGYYLDAANFTYVSNDYIDYVVFMADGNNLKARAYLKTFTWPTERTDLEVPVSGCATKIAPITTTTTTTTLAPATTTTAHPCPYVSGYFINKSIIELRGEKRTFKVYGLQGATFSYSVVDSSNSATLTSGTKTIGFAGSVDIVFDITLSTIVRVFDVTLTTTEACTLQLQTQPSTFKLYQGVDEKWLGDTFECCPEAGTLLSTNCVGEDQYGTYTDGQCGTVNSLIENSTECCPAAGTLLSTNCVGVDQYGTYTDGQCGTTNSLIESNSAACGYVPPTTTTTTAGPTTTTTTTAAPCTVCAGGINPISDFSAAVGGTSGTISITGTNISPSSVYTGDPNLVTVNLSGSTVTWTTNSSNTCGTAHIIVVANNTAGGNCCNEAEDFYITVTGCTGPTTTSTTTTTAAPTTWNCVNNSCVQVNDGTGTYSTLSACQASCLTTTTTTTTTTAAPVYYRFEQCNAAGTFVFQILASAPANNARYFNGINYFTYTGVATTLPGNVVSNLSGPMGSGCP